MQTDRLQDNVFPCGHTMNSRNLIICIDGTSNQFGAKNTNVIELYNLILKGINDNQQTWYNSGIGTYATPSWKSLRYYKKVLYHKIDLAIAWDFDRTVLAAYRWLSDNYKDGDCIFLFGFSRGAYQVRVLSAMIDKVGLIYKGNEMQIPFAYALYVDEKSDEPEATQVGSNEKMSMAERFKGAFSHPDVKVHFVGAWDTVSSIGVIRGKHMLPRTVDGMKHVCYFRHALALDERRVKFLPEYAYGGTTEPPRTSLDIIQDRRLWENIVDYSKGMTEEPQTLEVWFAGTHSDIGGGNITNPGMDRSRPPLRWMVYQAGAVGLRTALFKHDLTPQEQIHIQESLTWHWWPLECLPIRRLTFTRREAGKRITYKPHLGASRKIHSGQKIHGSFFLGDVPYTPKARPLEDDIVFWETLRSKRFSSDLVELELHEKIRLVMESFNDEPVYAVDSLQKIATSSDGRQAVYNKIVHALGNSDMPFEANVNLKHRLLESALDILTGNYTHPQLQLEHSSQIYPLVSDLWMSGNLDYKETAQEFMAQLTDPCMFVLQGHDDVVYSGAFSPDGELLASASFDQTIRVWNVKTGKQVGEPFRGHTSAVFSVAFSPSGEHLISASRDSTVRIWNVKTGTQDGDPLKHSSAVNCAVFSSDGQWIAAAFDKVVQIWDMKTRKPQREPLKHGDMIDWLSFSPDGNYLTSCSSDDNVWLWDLRTKDPVGRPLDGHTNRVLSVAFPPNDSKHIVSSSRDHTVRIWDVETGKQVGEPFPDDEQINAAEVSFDNKFVVSGSGSRVRIWDLETRERVMYPFQAHDAFVSSAQFSPDGKRVMSTSFDNTIRIWDVEILKLIT